MKHGRSRGRSRAQGVFYISTNFFQLHYAENAGCPDADSNANITNEDGYFDVTIPLSMILGFAEHYRNIIVNAKHGLILTRSRTDFNVIMQNVQENPAEFKILLNKVEWEVPYLFDADRHILQVFKFIEIDPLITLSFRTWEIYEYSLIPATQKHVWTVKTSTQIEKPRYIILAFETNRKDQRKQYADRFGHCIITNVKLSLNSQYYPYSNLNLNFDQNKFSLLYEMYANFQFSYYGKEPEPLLKKENFKKYAPLIVIDCSIQNEFLEQASVDV